MANLTTVAGIVSGVSANSTVTFDTTVSQNSGTSTTSASTSVSMHFRVDNRPAYMNVHVNLSNGDLITAAGIQHGEFETIAFHNHTTKTIYSMPEPNIFIGYSGIFVSLLLLSIPYLGPLSLLYAIWYCYDLSKKKNKIKQAKSMVEKAPAPVR